MLQRLIAPMLLATLASCAGPPPAPVSEATVYDPGTTCRAGRNGGPVLSERGIGGAGAAAKERMADRGIGGTGIVGVVTGFASICVDGLEVRFDKTVPVSIDGTTATMGQLLVGQLVIVKAGSTGTEPSSFVQARTISVRYEVSGPVEAMEDGATAMTVAGQRVVVLPTTWVAARPSTGNWIAVSGLRQPDGSIVASRLDRGRVGVFSVHGQISRERDTTRVGELVLRDPAVATIKAGTFVSVAGKYRNGLADITSVDADLLSQDPAGFFGVTTERLVVQAFVRVERGTVWLNNGQNFRAGAAVQGNGGGYRNAIIWLQRAADGVFTATDMHYTSYRGQPKDLPTRSSGGRGAGERLAPPEAIPGRSDPAPPDAAAGESNPGGTVGAAPTPSTDDEPTSKAAPLGEPQVERAIVADQDQDERAGGIVVVKFEARD